MSGGTVEEAEKTQRRNIEGRTGRSFEELMALVQASGLVKHGQIVNMLKDDLGMGHGDANLVAHRARAPTDIPSDPADDWYAAAKAAQRPLHDFLVGRIAAFGTDIEHAPKKTYLSLRRQRQFAMIGPAAGGTVEIGVNLRGASGDDRFTALKPGLMCTHRTRVSRIDEVDEVVMGWLQRAYDAASGGRGPD